MSNGSITYQLKTPISFIKGVGPTRAEVLQKELSIFTVGDLIQHYPFRYVDRTQVHSIKDVRGHDAYIQVKGVITNVSLIGQQRGKRLVATLQDETGKIDLIWFKGLSYIKSYLLKGGEYLVFGKPNLFRGQTNFNHPEIELIGESSASKSARIVPVYSSTEKLKSKGLDSRGIARIIHELISNLNMEELQEFLSEEIKKRVGLVNRSHAFMNVHFPVDDESSQHARFRLKFDEFFLMQMRLLKMKVQRKKFQGFVFEKLGESFDRFYENNLKFELTGAQKRVLKEIRKDTLTGSQMNRLLQGDVGSGKTVVGLMTMLIAIGNGFQACMMAPTEILAQQHYRGVKEMLEGLGLKVAILTGSVKGKARKQLLQYLEQGELDILIGTHALIEDTVKFQNLGMVIIDEQHRFGVAQRAKLWVKNTKPPHVLVMTATPIPRTLAMTVYGDLDVSKIDELPPGRKRVVTTHRFDSKRLEVFQFMKEQIALGRQIYLVYPLIKESEKMDYKDLMDGYESIQREFQSPKYTISIVHGQMKPADKDFEMNRFVEGKTNIMVATTVIEVGVNVPNASVMIIESAERFGLSQLHQLRGRVGRGADQSFCILMTDYKLSSDAKKRIRTMTETNDGFKIAEVDLRLRGPGDIEGTQQSGLSQLKIADLIQDDAVLKLARREAAQIFEVDPELNDHPKLKLFLDRKVQDGRLSWDRIS